MSVQAAPARRVVVDPSWRKEVVHDVLPVVVLSRLLFAVLTLLIPIWRVMSGVRPLLLHKSVTNTGTILDAWDRWDVHWYDDLAHLGYNLRGPTGFKNVAFFPLYPLLTRTLHDGMAVVAHSLLGVIPDGSLYPPYLVAAMLVSNACAIGAIVFFYTFMRLDYSRTVARRAVTLLALSPLSFFLAAAYSEGTFLLCAIAFFYTLRLERWWQAGLWGLLAAATRPPGAVLIVPFAMAWAEAHPVVTRSFAARLRLWWRAVAARVRTHRHVPYPTVMPSAVLIDLYQPNSEERTPRRRAGDVNAEMVHARKAGGRQGHDWAAEVRRALHNAAPVVAIPLGLGIFMAFLYSVFGDPLWFSRAQQAWWRTFAPPWETLYASVVWPLGDALRGRLTVVDLYALHDLLYEIVGLVLTWLAWRRLPRTQGVYMWLLWFVVLSSPAMLTEQRTGEPHHDVLMSLPRMLLMMFPLFTYLGLHRRLYPWLLGLFTVVLTAYTAMFLTGGWVS